MLWRGWEIQMRFRRHEIHGIVPLFKKVRVKMGDGSSVTTICAFARN